MLTEDRLTQYSATGFWRGEMAGEVISLYDMLTEFDVMEAAELYQAIELPILSVEKELYSRNFGQPPPTLGKLLVQCVNIFSAYSVTAKIANVQDYVAVLKTALRAKSDVMRIADILKDIRTTIRNELNGQKCFMVSRDCIKYLEADAIPQIIRDYFPECIRDLEQANKCLAFGLDAACVYHCGCLLQPTLEYLAASVHVLGGTYDPKSVTRDQLGKICNILDKQVATLDNASKSDAVREELKLLGDLVRLVRAILHSWRHDNAHGRNTYAPGEVEKILQGTSNLVEYLAQKKGSANEVQL